MHDNIKVEKIISGPIWDTIFFPFLRFQLCYMLGIVSSCNLVQYQGKLMNQTWENCKKPSLGPIVAHLAHIRAANLLFSKLWLHQSPLVSQPAIIMDNIRKN